MFAGSAPSADIISLGKCASNRLLPSHLDGLPTPRRYWALVAIAVGVALAAMSSTVINIALPRVSQSLSADAATVVWSVIIFQLAISVSLFPLAFLGDRVGHKYVYAGGIALFTIACVFCALATNIGELVIARALQGLGASGIVSVNIALVRFIYPASKLGRGVAYNTLIVGLSVTVGPSVASVVLSVADWQWLFLINVPLGIMASIVAFLTLPSTPRVARNFDLFGAVLTALALGIFVVAIDGIGRRDEVGLLALEFVASGALIVSLILHQRRAPVPILPLDLLRLPNIGLSGLTSVCSYIVQGLSFVVLPFYFHDILSFSQSMVGAAMTPWPLAVMLASPLAGRLSDRFSAGHLGTLGLSLLTVGLVGLAVVSNGASVVDVGWRMALCGFGFGLFQMPNSRAIIENAPRSRSGGASAIQAGARLFGQSIGAAFGAACLGVMESRGAQAGAFIAVSFAALACGVSASRLRF